MNTNNLLAIIIILAWITITLFIILHLYIKPYLDKKNNVLEKREKRKMYQLYSTIDPKLVRNTVMDYIDEYIDRYIMMQFTAQKIIYINNENATKMIKDITTAIIIEITELQLFYMKLIYDIQDDEDLARYVHLLVSRSALEKISLYNTTNIPSM